jgi:hypothetical protein
MFWTGGCASHEISTNIVQIDYMIISHMIAKVDNLKGSVDDDKIRQV